MANIKKALAAREWRQADLARATGLTPTGLGAIVNGHSWPGPDTLARIAEALKIQPCDLLRSPEGNMAVELPARLQLFELIASLNEEQAGLLLVPFQEMCSGLMGEDAGLDLDEETYKPAKHKSR